MSKRMIAKEVSFWAVLALFFVSIFNLMLLEGSNDGVVQAKSDEAVEVVKGSTCLLGPMLPSDKCVWGKASYYGPYDPYSRAKFHGRRTASGEIFDMYGMTAAHRTLPFGTKVRVFWNGNSVDVVINDRGPYKRNSQGKFVAHPTRIIDLSYGAAKKLGFLSQGVVKVRICYWLPKKVLDK